MSTNNSNISSLIPSIQVFDGPGFSHVPSDTLSHLLGILDRQNSCTIITVCRSWKTTILNNERLSAQRIVTFFLTHLPKWQNSYGNEIENLKNLNKELTGTITLDIHFNLRRRIPIMLKQVIPDHLDKLKKKFPHKKEYGYFIRIIAAIEILKEYERIKVEYNLHHINDINRNIALQNLAKKISQNSLFQFAKEYLGPKKMHNSNSFFLSISQLESKKGLPEQALATLNSIQNLTPTEKNKHIKEIALDQLKNNLLEGAAKTIMLMTDHISAMHLPPYFRSDAFRDFSLILAEKGFSGKAFTFINLMPKDLLLGTLAQPIALYAIALAQARKGRFAKARVTASLLAGPIGTDQRDKCFAEIQELESSKGSGSHLSATKLL